jgi:entericidin B
MTRVVLCLLAVGMLAACETVEGLGRDVSTAGETITGEAQKAEQ